MTKSATRRGGIAAMAVSAAIAALLTAPLALDGAGAATASRLQGPTRYETAVAISNRSFANGGNVVYLARGDGFADALAAGSLTDGPVLLVPPDGSIPSAITSEVNRLNPPRVVALGGAGAVPDSTLATLGQGRQTSRLQGSTRYDTAVAISKAGFANGAATTYLARGDGFADALAAGALTGGPLLLVPSDGSLPPAVSAEVNRLNPANVVALGGTSAVPASTLSTLASGRNSNRLQGATRFDTAVAISQAAFPSGAGTTFLARADGFADALAAGSLTGGPILLVPTSGPIPSVVGAEIRRLASANVVALGGPAAVSDATLAAAAGGGSTTSTTSGGGSTTSTTSGGGGGSGTGHRGRTFDEMFTWKGEHASTIAEGGTTVWWDANNWDVRGDTHYIAVVPNDARNPGEPPWKGFHVDVHKAATAADTDPRPANTTNVQGGDGSPGVGVMHIDHQGILSARLRNPMVVSSSQPGVITFYAPKFVTTGTWWEVALTPATSVSGAEYSAIPGRLPGQFLNDPLTGQPGDGSTNGPGHHQRLQDSVNIISTGYPDAPTCDGSGWHARYALSKFAGGHHEHFVRAAGSMDKLVTVDPNDRTLVNWRITVRPGGVTLESDFDDNNVFEPREQWTTSVPWSEVYVHLIYAAYQADHHPQVGCGYGVGGVSQIQETQWKEVLVSPVKYERTVSLPRATATRRQGGWLFYDLRDIQRVGSVNGVPQANPSPYDRFSSYRWCSNPSSGIVCGDQSRAASTVTLPLDIAAGDVSGLRRAQVVADIRRAGTVGVEVNGTSVGTLAPVVGSEGEGSEFESIAWVRRSIEVPPSLLKPGANTIKLYLSPNQTVDVDRVELELSLGG